MHPRTPVVALSMLVLLAGAAVQGQDSLPEVGERVVVLKDRRIDESSGLALGIRDPSVFWTQNDSGGEPCIFAIDLQGQTRAKVRLRDAANFDWEALATYKDAAGRSWVFVGDIGDNFHLRPTVQVYQIEEPVLPALAEAGKEIESAKPRVWHLTYPGGPRDAEALLVHPVTGRLYVITKSNDGNSTLYACPETLAGNRANSLEKVIDLHFPPTVRLGKRPRDAALVTDASFSPDGRRLVVATYSYLHEWTLQNGEALAAALARPAKILKPLLVPSLEALCYDADSRSLWLTSEHLPTPLCRISRKD